MGIGPCIADLSICLIVHIGQLMSLKWSRQKSFMVLIPGGARVEELLDLDLQVPASLVLAPAIALIVLRRGNMQLRGFQLEPPRPSKHRDI